MTTLIHANKLEEVPLRTSTAVLNSLYPPPPHTHTHKTITMIHVMNWKRYLRRQRIFSPFYPTHNGHNGHDDSNTREQFAVGTDNYQRNFKFPLIPTQKKMDAYCTSEYHISRKNTYHFNRLLSIASCRLSVLLFKWTCSCDSIQSSGPEIN